MYRLMYMYEICKMECINSKCGSSSGGSSSSGGVCALVVFVFVQ